MVKNPELSTESGLRPKSVAVNSVHPSGIRRLTSLANKSPVRLPTVLSTSTPGINPPILNELVYADSRLISSTSFAASLLE